MSWSVLCTTHTCSTPDKRVSYIGTIVLRAIPLYWHWQHRSIASNSKYYYFNFSETINIRVILSFPCLTLRLISYGVTKWTRGHPTEKLEFFCVFFSLYNLIENSEAAMGVLRSLKRQVRAAQQRVTQQKPTTYFNGFQFLLCCSLTFEIMLVEAGLVCNQGEYDGGEDARAQSGEADEECQGPHAVISSHRP